MHLNKYTVLKFFSLHYFQCTFPCACMAMKWNSIFICSSNAIICVNFKWQWKRMCLVINKSHLFFCKLQWWIPFRYRDIFFLLFIFLPVKYYLFLNIDEGIAKPSSLRMSAENYVAVIVFLIFNIRLNFKYAVVNLKYINV